MPAQVNLAVPIITVTFSGTVTVGDLKSVAKTIAEFEQGVGRSVNRLVDLTRMEATGITFTLTMNAARHRRTQVFPNSFRSALLAPTAETVGFARMFQILNSNPQIELRIFGTAAEAETWLNSPAM